MPPWFRHYSNLPVFYRSADVEGSGGSENESTDETATNVKTAPEATAKKDDGETEVAKLVERAVADAVAGLKKKNDELIGKEKKLREELTAAKAKPSLSEEEYAQFKTLQEKIERDELLKALTEGRTEDVIAKVTQKTRLDYEAKLAAEAEARAAREQEATTWKARYEQTLINNEITKAAAGAIKPQYQDLIAKLVSDRVKLVDGAVRIVNEDGEIETTASGNKPLTVTDYIETMRSNYADLFIAPVGGGAAGSGTSKTPRGTSNKISMENAENLPFEEYQRLRMEGKI